MKKRISAQNIIDLKIFLNKTKDVNEFVELIKDMEEEDDFENDNDLKGDEL